MHYVTSEHYAKIRAIVQYERDSAKRSVMTMCEWQERL